jgi:hypothetical protein
MANNNTKAKRNRLADEVRAQKRSVTRAAIQRAEQDDTGKTPFPREARQAKSSHWN